MEYFGCVFVAVSLKAGILEKELLSNVTWCFKATAGNTEIVTPSKAKGGEERAFIKNQRKKKVVEKFVRSVWERISLRCVSKRSKHQVNVKLTRVTFPPKFSYYRQQTWKSALHNKDGEK